MARLTASEMTAGQLKLQFASLCQYHQCDGVAALGHASRVPLDLLRGAIVEYEMATNDKTRERALLRVVEWKKD